MIEASRWWWVCTHCLYGAVGQLHAERLQGADEVDGERVSLLPEADQQTHSDPSQDGGLSDSLVDGRPVPVGASGTLRRVVCDITRGRRLDELKIDTRFSSLSAIR